MKMLVKCYKNEFGLTLVEVMLSVAIITIAAVGSLGYQYHAAKHSYIARIQIVGSRTAQLLVEDWKSKGGSTSYDPTAMEMVRG